jgi:hypothetical protein
VMYPSQLVIISADAAGGGGPRRVRADRELRMVLAGATAGAR